MASAFATITTRSPRVPMDSFGQLEKENVPYGLPVVDHCQQCKLRNEGYFCALSQPSLQDLDRVKHSTSYPEGALVFMEGQAARGVYILCQGSAKLFTTNSDGKTFI